MLRSARPSSGAPVAGKPPSPPLRQGVGGGVTAVVPDDSPHHAALGIVQPRQRARGPRPEPSAFERLAGQRHRAGGQHHLVLDGSAGGHNGADADQRALADAAGGKPHIVPQRRVPADDRVPRLAADARVVLDVGALADDDAERAGIESQPKKMLAPSCNSIRPESRAVLAMKAVPGARIVAALGAAQVLAAACRKPWARASRSSGVSARTGFAGVPA